MGLHDLHVRVTRALVYLTASASESAAWNQSTPSTCVQTDGSLACRSRRGACTGMLDRVANPQFLALRQLAKDVTVRLSDPFGDQSQQIVDAFGVAPRHGWAVAATHQGTCSFME